MRRALCGLTIIELIVSLSLSALMMILLTTLYLWQQKQFERQELLSRERQAACTVMQLLALPLRSATIVQGTAVSLCIAHKTTYFVEHRYQHSGLYQQEMGQRKAELVAGIDTIHFRYAIIQGNTLQVIDAYEGLDCSKVIGVAISFVIKGHHWQTFVVLRNHL